MRRKGLRLGATSVVAAVTMSFVAFGMSCSREPSEAAQWVAEIRAANAEADTLVARDAIVVLEDAAALEIPRTVSAEDRRVVRADLAYRIASLELSRGHAPRAVDVATRALAECPGDDVFRANLLIVRGHARELAGDAPAAAEDYYQALRINDALLQRALSEREER